MLHIAFAPPLGPPASAGPERTTGQLPRLAARLLAWRRRRATISALYALDDRTLKDIGLIRAEVEFAVYTGGEDRRLRFVDGAGRTRQV